MLPIPKAGGGKDVSILNHMSVPKYIGSADIEALCVGAASQRMGVGEVLRDESCG